MASNVSSHLGMKEVSNGEKTVDYVSVVEVGRMSDPVYAVMYSIVSAARALEKLLVTLILSFRYGKSIRFAMDSQFGDCCQIKQQQRPVLLHGIPDMATRDANDSRPNRHAQEKKKTAMLVIIPLCKACMVIGPQRDPRHSLANEKQNANEPSTGIKKMPCG